MIHTVLYHGRYNLNLDRLREYEGHLHDFKRLDEEGNEWELESPSKNVKGIVFGYMEKGKEGLPDTDRFFAVRVEDVVLRNPIRLEPDLHTDGKWFGPQPSQFEDESARKLLADIIEANPEQSTELMRIYNRFFGQL